MKKEQIPEGTEDASMRKRVDCLILCICLMLSVMVGAARPVMAAKEEGAAVVTFEELNDDSVFLKQSRPHVCTLTSCAMMIRRAAMLSGDEDWADITEQSIRKTAWSEGVGLKWDFTVSGITVKHKNLASKTELISLLEAHPEGIVIYNTRMPHSILVTDHTDGVFYCSDPSNGSPSGRYPVSQASITVESASRCWYVKRPVGLKVIRDDVVYEEEGLLYRILSPLDKTVACIGQAEEAKDVTVPETVQLNGEEYQVTEIAENAFANAAKLCSITIGGNVAVIGQKAFYKCKKLKTVLIDTEHLQEIGAETFAKIYKKARILLKSEEQIEVFAKLLQGTALPITVLVGVQGADIG